MMDKANQNPLAWSVLALILANAVPLFGVLFFDWNGVLVLALYWIENLIIGFFTLIKLAIAAIVQKQAQGLFLIPFFIVHYGVFCSAHGMILSEILAVETVQWQNQYAGFLDLFADGASVFYTFFSDLQPMITIGIATLFLSRLVSFIENALLKAEILEQKLNTIMMAPYSQIVVMHIGLIIGAIILTKMHSPVWLLAIIVIFKIVVDYQQHRRRHRADHGAEEIKDV